MNPTLNAISLSEEQVMSKTIDWLRFPMAVMVVFIHYAPSSIEIPESIGDSLINILLSAVSRQFSSVAVPLFFLFSGYLFFYRIESWNREIYLSKIKKRFSSLFVPYVIWNTVLLLMSVASLSGKAVLGKGTWDDFYAYLIGELPHFLWDSSAWEGSYAFMGLYGPIQGTGPLDLPLWFIRNLMIIMLLAPLWHWLISRFRFSFLFALGIAYVLGVWFMYFPFCITGVFWFCFGAYLSILGKNLVTFFEQGRWPALLFWLLMGVFCVFLDLNGYQRILSVAAPIMIITGVWAVIRSVSKFIRNGVISPIALLSSSSFFIFALHQFRIKGDVLKGLELFLSKLNPIDQGFHDSLLFLTWTPVSVGIMLLLYFLLGKFCPRILAVLTGGRTS